MNQKDFKTSMRQGLGRCILALQSSDNIEKYKDIVLWGCLHNLAYDTQCEGTRASYVYKLSTYFHDEAYFLTPCIEAFEKLSRKSDWLFSHFTELLAEFATHGNQCAATALKKKYHHLLSILKKKKRFTGYDYERDYFEKICITYLSIGKEEILLEIAKDMGELFQNNSHYSHHDFEWFFSCAEHRIRKTRLRQEAKKSKTMAVFYQHFLKAAEESNKFIKRKTKEAPTADDVINEIMENGTLKPSTRIRFALRADINEQQKLAMCILDESNLDAKAELLSVFRDTNFPLSHQTITMYAESEHEKLRAEALEVLIGCQSEEVRAYALRLLAENKHKAHAVQMLLRNYKSTDKDLLLSELYQIEVDYDSKSDWHAIDGTILNVCDQNIKLPKEFFLYIYNTTLCSCCREYAIRAMAKRRQLTRDIIEECRHDSNCDISTYVNRYYPTK